MALNNNKKAVNVDLSIKKRYHRLPGTSICHGDKIYMRDNTYNIEESLGGPRKHKNTESFMRADEILTDRSLFTTKRELERIAK